MFSIFKKRCWLAGAFAIIGVSLALPTFGEAVEFKAGAIGEPLGELNMQVWRVPVELEDGSGTITLEATVFKPDGEGPLPLAVFNHGMAADAPTDGAYDFRPDAAIRWFLARGYAVAVVIRRGYGRSEGVRSVVKGDNSSYALELFEETIHDIKSAVSYFRKQQFVANDKVVLVGLSAGGNGVLGVASKAPEGVLGVVTFAPGAGAINRYKLGNTDRVERDFRAYGSTVKVPVLWIYADNDELFSPKLAQFYFEAFTSESDAEQELVILPLDGEKGHGVFLWDNGPEIWGHVVEPFLKRVMP
ncbi:alpha/beta hydrolase family protein [Pseudovibrio sp. SCP19]|uniref:alpha/beta hydrolase family protein n=1 Tax=Pseudovibrio sp. SCP19 TaxID=3141374 RepID=UPI003337B524